MPHYNPFWLAYCAGLICLSPLFSQRDEPEAEPAHSAEIISMNDWLKMKEAERAAVVEEYAHRRPLVRYGSTKERRRELAS